jgi:energy-coupling factor transporter transmembrane protein EcfT
MASQLMDQIIDRAEEISYALESRRFTPYVLHDSLSWRTADSLILIGIIVYLAVTSILVVII